MLKQPDIVFETRPMCTRVFADFLASIRTLRTRLERRMDNFVD